MCVDVEIALILRMDKPQNKYTSTVFINLRIFVDVDGTITFNKRGK